MRIIINDTIGNISKSEYNVSTDEMQWLLGWLKSRGCDVEAAQPDAQSDGLRSMPWEYQQEVGGVVTKKVGVIRHR